MAFACAHTSSASSASRMWERRVARDSRAAVVQVVWEWMSWFEGSNAGRAHADAGRRGDREQAAQQSLPMNQPARPPAVCSPLDWEGGVALEEEVLAAALAAVCLASSSSQRLMSSGCVTCAAGQGRAGVEGERPQGCSTHCWVATWARAAPAPTLQLPKEWNGCSRQAQSGNPHSHSHARAPPHPSCAP